MTKESKSGSNEPEKLDLNQLKGLDFGPDWSEPSSSRPTPTKSDKEKSSRRSSAPKDRRPARKRTGAAPQTREQFFEPVVQFSIYPEDEPFDLLTQSIRSSLKVYELFEVTRLILDKADRMVVVVAPLTDKDPPLYECLGDRQLFREEARALKHAAMQALPVYFTQQEEEVDPPSGNFSSVLRCGITGRYLPPKNYHRFQALLAEHHRLHCPEKPISRVEKSLEAVNEPKAVEEWLNSMKKRTVYRLRPEGGAEAEATAQSVEPPSAEKTGQEPPAEDEPEGSSAADDSSEASGETESPPEKNGSGETGGRLFETREDALQYILLHKREGLIRETRQARVPGKALQVAEDESIRKSFETYLEKQKRFPLDTANNVRMKLRKAKFFLFKRGKKGVSYVAAVRRKNREPDAVFAESAQNVIRKIEENPGLKLRDLPGRLYPDRTAEEGKSVLSDEEKRKLLNDLKWLKLEGYLYEFGDGTLEVQPLAAKPQAGKPVENTARAAEKVTVGEGTDPEDSPNSD